MTTDTQFLVRAADYFRTETALDNQTKMFVYVWNALSAEEQSNAVKIWQDSAQSKGQNSVIPQQGIELIKEFEGYHEELEDGRVKAYADPIHGWTVPTIGYGTTKYPDGRKVQQGDLITREQAEKYLIWEIDHLCRPVLEKIPTWEQMNANQRGALYSFAYNLGAYFYGGADFQSITKVCDSIDRWTDTSWIKEQFVKYRNPGSAAEVGLRRRREAEADLFCTPVS